jgi:class 3 adenylate cyclase
MRRLGCNDSGNPTFFYIQVTATTYEKLQSKFAFEERGVLQVKGKGEMMTYFLKNYK